MICQQWNNEILNVDSGVQATCLQTGWSSNLCVHSEEYFRVDRLHVCPAESFRSVLVSAETLRADALLTSHIHLL